MGPRKNGKNLVACCVVVVLFKHISNQGLKVQILREELGT